MFGIDIGTSSIKIAQLKVEGNKWRLVAAGITHTPPSGLMSESERDVVSLAEAIKKLLSDAKITTREAVVSLPETKVFTRIVSFPAMSDPEVSSAVGWQIESFIPIAKKDAVYDHEVVGRDEKGVQVLLVAVPKIIVQKYMRILNAANLIPAAFETELLALSRSIAPPQKRVLLVDFGATSTDLAVVVNQRLMFSRSFSTAGQALTRAVATGIGVEEKRAEEYKRAYGLGSQLQGKVKQALDPVLFVIVDEIKKAMGFWLEEHRSEPIEAVVVVGGTAGLPSLTPLLAEALKIEVDVGNPFSEVLLDPTSQKTLLPYAPLYAIAVGLAMRKQA